MIKALNDQLSQASKILYTYGKDNSGQIEYKFNSSGFRNNTEFNFYPDFVIFGGSTNFGIGTDFNYCYWSIIARNLKLKFWNCSYANFNYNNKIIYETILSGSEHIKNKPIIVQWVGDNYNPTDRIKVYEYSQLIKQQFPVSINFLIDGNEEKTNATKANFDLINPLWVDTDIQGFHPGKKTHNLLANWILKKYVKKFSKI